MADFVAVIRKAVGNLSENTPENRAKVFEKARAAIRRQLEAINPPPSEEVMKRQLDKLDAAIAEVESEHAEALPVEHDADALMAELEALVEKSEQARPAPAAPDAPVMPAAAPPRATPHAAPTHAATPPVAPPKPAAPVAAPAPQWQPEAPVARPPEPEMSANRLRPISGDEHDDAFGLNEPREAPRRQPRETLRRPNAARPAASGRPSRRGAARLAAIVAVLVLLVAGAYAAWSQRSALEAFLGLGASQTETAADQPADAAQTPVAEPAAEPVPEVEPEDPADTEVALATPAESTPAVPAAGEAAPGGKFTQRLNADGTETDPGPAPEAEDQTAVEGRSVAALTETAAGEGGVQSGETAAPVGEQPPAEAAPVTDQQQTAPASQPIGVAQKMFLYEERLDQQSPTVTEGTVVWSLVTQPDETGKNDVAVRGEINDPDNGLSALITIKRNTDTSLPASHIIEVVFAVPGDFAGGSIDQVQRVALKQTEQDQGDPLIAVSAKITQDFYMIALNDLASAVDQNTTLLRQRNWIDIPVIYTNGRRALITLEKGTSGVEVFSQALDAWARP
ncbi:hypothetical protein DFR52_11058 [Hoeflea marina]|uniref:CheA signal transduction histidine kinase n=1 Tax=Hoeflea marina TaxID=274592 RepID=A0A317PC14_9HYPH|nr:hypothetical protein [Hoeflea marina]PWV95529.1 hypothetical protein DFR52_11058 [Hoeflea marina]